MNNEIKAMGEERKGIIDSKVIDSLNEFCNSFESYESKLNEFINDYNELQTGISEVQNYVDMEGNPSEKAYNELQDYQKEHDINGNVIAYSNLTTQQKKNIATRIPGFLNDVETLQEKLDERANQMFRDADAFIQNLESGMKNITRAGEHLNNQNRVYAAQIKSNNNYMRDWSESLARATTNEEKAALSSKIQTLSGPTKQMAVIMQINSSIVNAANKMNAIFANVTENIKAACKKGYKNYDEYKDSLKYTSEKINIVASLQTLTASFKTIKESYESEKELIKDIKAKCSELKKQADSNDINEFYKQVTSITNSYSKTIEEIEKYNKDNRLGNTNVQKSEQLEEKPEEPEEKETDVSQTKKDDETIKPTQTEQQGIIAPPLEPTQNAANGLEALELGTPYYDFEENTTKKYIVDENATLARYKSEGFGQNAYGWYFDPSRDDYFEDYNPLNDASFQVCQSYNIINEVNEEATMNRYRSEGFGQNAYGWYFDPSRDDYFEDYNPLNDPSFQIMQTREEEAGLVNRDKLGTLYPKKDLDKDKDKDQEPNQPAPNPGGTTNPGGPDNQDPGQSGKTGEKEPGEEQQQNPEEAKKGKLWLKCLCGLGGFAAGVGLSTLVAANPVLGTVIGIYAGARMVYQAGKLGKKIITKINHGNVPQFITNIESRIPDKVKKAAEILFNRPKNVYAKWFVNGMSIGYLADQIFDIHGQIADAISNAKEDIPTDPNDLIDEIEQPNTTLSEPDPTPDIQSIEELDGQTLDLSNLEYGYRYSGSDDPVHLLESAAKNVTLDKVRTVDGVDYVHFLQENGDGFAWFKVDDVIKAVNDSGQLKAAIAETAGKSL